MIPNMSQFKGTPVMTQTLKLCETCLIYRPPRTVHCNVCDCCVRGFDHHCLWLGTCIGYRNYLSFQAYIIQLSIALPIAAVQSIKAIVQILSDEYEGKEIVLASSMGLLAFALIAVSYFWSVYNFCFHVPTDVALCLNLGPSLSPNPPLFPPVHPLHQLDHLRAR